MRVCAQDEPAIRYLGETSRTNFDVSYSLNYLSALEPVYAEPGSENKVSELRWSGWAHGLLNLQATHASDSGFVFSAAGHYGLGSNAYLEDYDWFGADFRSYADGDWTHRSQHENTDIDWYVAGELAAGFRLIDDVDLNWSLDARARYTSAQWTANGGSYVYSDGTFDNAGDNFRAYRGTIPNEPVISYKQQFPALLIGTHAEIYGSGIRMGLDGAIGTTVGAKAVDHHWLRDLVIDDQLNAALTFNLAVDFAYEFADSGWALLLGAEHERIFNGRGDSSWTENGVPVYAANSTDSAGASFKQTSIMLGMRRYF